MLPKVSLAYELNALLARELTPGIFSEAKFYRPGFFVHQAPQDPTLLRYRPPEKEGFSLSKDFVTIKPGRFLSKYFPKLSPEKVADLANQWRLDGLPPDLLIATDPDRIEWVYRNGPSSCMTNSDLTEKTSGIHPTRAYAGPDLAVAYIMRKDKPVARAVVWPDKKRHNIIYGDVKAMQQALSREGYSRGSMAGAKLTAIESPIYEAVKQTYMTSRFGRLTLNNEPLGPAYIVPFGDNDRCLEEVRDESGQVKWLQIMKPKRGQQFLHIMNSKGLSVESVREKSSPQKELVV